MKKDTSKNNSLLNNINSPKDLKKLIKGNDDLYQVANEIRQEIVDKVSITGGHLGAGLGVVELTTAIHYVFNTPDDKLIWDVGHQSSNSYAKLGYLSTHQLIRHGISWVVGIHLSGIPN